MLPLNHFFSANKELFKIFLVLMSLPHPPKPAKLIVGFFLKDKGDIHPLVSMLSERFGPIDLVSPWFPFDFTTYYADEMGYPLFRKLIVFKTLVEQNHLPEIKLITNEIEMTFSKNGKRPINIDPGYMVHERFVLGTGKNYTHRIYLDRGIYADLTLIYQKGTFKPLPWTYPDYSAPEMIVFLQTVRNKYVIDFKEFSETSAGE